MAVCLVCFTKQSSCHMSGWMVVCLFVYYTIPVCQQIAWQDSNVGVIWLGNRTLMNGRMQGACQKNSRPHGMQHGDGVGLPHLKCLFLICYVKQSLSSHGSAAGVIGALGFLLFSWLDST